MPDDAQRPAADPADPSKPAEATIERFDPVDRGALLALDQSAFGFDDRGLDAEDATAWIEWDRAFRVRRGDSLAAIYAVFSFGLGVPSGTAGTGPAAISIPMAGLSWVSVHPDHRRRGLLRAMMRHHLDTVRIDGRGEAISGLFASEPGIYGRFGYGETTRSRRMVLRARRPLRPPRDAGEVETRMEPADPDRHGETVQRVYERELLLRPGLTRRPATHGARQLADDPARRPDGAERLKIVVAEHDGQPTGYALLRRSQSWADSGPTGTVAVHDLRAADAPSAWALWQRVVDLDLMATVKTPWLPLDHPLTVWAAEAGATEVPGPSLWIRIVDLPSALSSRGYACPVDVVLDVSDELCPQNAGRWRLSADGAGASCERTAHSADISLDIRELGAAYLGGVTLETLAQAGLVEELTPGAVAVTSRAWRSPLLPATPYMF